MKIICSWCGKNLGEKPPYKDKSTTHGICKKCAKKMEDDADPGPAIVAHMPDEYVYGDDSIMTPYGKMSGLPRERKA